MRRLLAVCALVLVPLLCSACGDSGVGKLGQQVVASLSSDPLVAEARYSYWSPGLDDPQEPNLIFSITAASEQVGLPAFQPLISRTAAQVWQSRTNLSQLWYVISARGFAQPTQTRWPLGGAVPEGKLIQLCVRLGRTAESSTGSAAPSSEPTVPDPPTQWRPLVQDSSFNDCNLAGRKQEQQFADTLAADLFARYGLHRTS